MKRSMNDDFILKPFHHINRTLIRMLSCHMILNCSDTNNTLVGQCFWSKIVCLKNNSVVLL